MAQVPGSPAPGNYTFDFPVGWEEDESEITYRMEMAKLYPDDEDYRPDPVLLALQAEAEAGEDAEFEKAQMAPGVRAKYMKRFFAASRTPDFEKGLGQKQSVESFISEDFMDFPDYSIMELEGEDAYMNAFIKKARGAKRMRKLLAQADSSDEEETTPRRSCSPKKAKSPAKKASPKKNVCCDDTDISPMKFNKSTFNAVAKLQKKSFFSDPSSPSPKKFATPKKAPAKKTFFAPIVSSDSGSDLEMPAFKSKFTAGKKSFFSDPTASPSPKKMSVSQAAFPMAALDAQLHQRQRELISVQAGDKLYKPSAFLPGCVVAFLSSRKGTPGFQETAVKIEELIIKAMISKLEAGQVKCNPHELLEEAKLKLKNEYSTLAASLNMIDQM